VLKKWYLFERKEKIDRNYSSGFLWPEEKRLICWLIG